MKWYLPLNLALVALLLAAVFSGCSATSIDTPGLIQGPGTDTSPVLQSKFIERTDTSVLLDVPFLPQVPPGNWAATRNCGQASAAMMRAYYFGEVPTPDDILRADHWLNANYGVALNGGNSDFTNVFMIRSWLEEEGVPARVGMGSMETLKNLLREGKPVLLAAYSDMNPNGGAKHAMVAIGYDDNYIYVNDPGKISGEHNSYSINRVLSAWQAQGNWYVALR